MIVPTLPSAILLLLLGGVFIHFLHAGSRIFYFLDAENELGAWMSQFSFLVTGTMVTWALGIRMPIPVANQVAAALALASSVSLYEWTRHTIRGRRFGLAWGDHVPETLCEDGPYRHIRHPIYLSYALAFLAVLIALPHWVTALTFLFNLALFVIWARSDEREIADSALAADYAAYRERTGRFFPKLSRAVPGKQKP